MPEIRLNKPLFKEETAPQQQTAQQPAGPISPQPGFVARLAALIVDILLLVAVCMLFVKFFPDVAVRLGRGGPWVGLLIGFAYFSVGYGALTDGRTAGKALLKLRIQHTDGPALAPNAAALRALLLLWPLALFNLLNQVAEAHTSSSEITVIPEIGLLGLAIALGWFAGNAIHCGLEPQGRTWYDRAVSAVVVSTEADSATIIEFLRQARENSDAVRQRRAALSLVVCVGALGVAAGSLLWSKARTVSGLPADKRERILAGYKAANVPEFGMPIPLPPAPLNPKPNATPVPGARPDDPVLEYKYLHWGPVDTAALRSNEAALSAVDRITSANQEELRKELRKAANPNDFLSSMPKKIVFRTSFAQYSDLLFARQTSDVLVMSREVDMDRLHAQVRAETGAGLATKTPAVTTEPKTLAVAEAGATTPVLENALTSAPLQQR